MSTSYSPAVSSTPQCLAGYTELLAGSGNGVAGSADGAGSAAGFLSPQGLAVGGGTVYVADTSNNRIRALVLSTAAVSTLAGNGAAGYVDSATSSAARFSLPAAVALAGATLYVADTGNSRIRAVATAGGAVTTLAGASGGNGVVDGAGSAATFKSPQGIAASASTVFVADTGNGLIRTIVIATGVVATLAGRVGSLGLADGAGSAALFSSSLYGLALTPDGGTLFAADAGNAAIRVVATAGGVVSTPVLSAPLTPVGLALNGKAAGDAGLLLYAANASGNTVATVQPNAAFAVTTLAGAGAGNSPGGHAPVFSAPAGVAVTQDANSRDVVTVADTDHNALYKVFCSSFISPTSTNTESLTATASVTGSASFDAAGVVAQAQAAGLATGGAIAGGVAGALLLVAAGVVIFYVARRSRRRNSKAVLAATQRQSMRALKDTTEQLSAALAAKEAERAALEAALTRAQRMGSPAPSPALGGGSGPNSPALGGAADPLNSFNPLAARAASLRTLTKVDSAPMLAQGALSGAASAGGLRAAGGLARAPSISETSTARGSIMRTSSGRAIPAPMTAMSVLRAPAATAEAQHTAVWSPEHGAYYFVNKRSGASVWEITDAAEMARIRAESKAAGLSPLPFDDASQHKAAAFTATWSDEHKCYYFVNKATGGAVWELGDEELARVRAEAAAAGLSPLP